MAEWYAIVQHSGFSTGHAEFEHAVEVRIASTAAEIRAVKAVGGLLFETWKEADEFCDKANYPDDEGLIPHAQGTFSHRKVDGLAIYQPVRAVLG